MIQLTDGERVHPIWLRLVEHYNEQLNTLRAKNDGALSEMETATLRGQIRMVKGFLELGKERPTE